jgi:hypothetical protein
LPITDRCIPALGHKYHPEHFTCAGCGTGLRGKQFKEWESDPYCLACHGLKKIQKRKIARSFACLRVSFGVFCLWS